MLIRNSEFVIRNFPKLPLPSSPPLDYPPAPTATAAAPGAARSRPLWFPFPLTWYERLPLVLVGGVLVILLAVSSRLTPDPAGLGTHHQLGLPPCTVRQWVGIRCPSCGMTTSWAHMVRGQVLSSVKANSGGALLAIVAATAGPWMLVCGLRGRWLLCPPNEWVVLGIGLAVVFITMMDWMIRLSWTG